MPSGSETRNPKRRPTTTTFAPVPVLDAAQSGDEADHKTLKQERIAARLKQERIAARLKQERIAARQQRKAWQKHSKQKKQQPNDPHYPQPKTNKADKKKTKSVKFVESSHSESDYDDTNENDEGSLFWSVVKWLVVGLAIAALLYFTGGLAAIPFIAPYVAQLELVIIPVVGVILAPVTAFLWNFVVKPIAEFFSNCGSDKETKKKKGAKPSSPESDNDGPAPGAGPKKGKRILNVVLEGVAEEKDFDVEINSSSSSESEEEKKQNKNSGKKSSDLVTTPVGAPSAQAVHTSLLPDSVSSHLPSNRQTALTVDTAETSRTPSPVTKSTTSSVSPYRSNLAMVLDAQRRQQQGTQAGLLSATPPFASSRSSTSGVASPAGSVTSTSSKKLTRGQLNSLYPSILPTTSSPMPGFSPNRPFQPSGFPSGMDFWSRFSQANNTQVASAAAGASQTPVSDNNSADSSDNTAGKMMQNGMFSTF